ncbi:MgtC/SapB family protein [Alkalibacterium psychrotolerans]
MAINYEIIITRIILSTIIGSLIGYERELKGRDAGMRTHTLVSIGATIITIIQIEASNTIINIIDINPEFGAVLSTDITRLTAQVVNGIGFLGAGTIIVSKKHISGLTTAASIWAVASIGIAIGMGNYFLSIFSTLIILIVLRLIKKIFSFNRSYQFCIKYKNKDSIENTYENYNNENNISIVAIRKSFSIEETEEKTYEDYVTMKSKKNAYVTKFLNSLEENPNIIYVTTINNIQDS